MSSTTVHVKEISSNTSEKEVRDFFSFCGKLSNITMKSEADGKQSATVTFEKPTAAKTALLLDNTQLKESVVQVSSSATGGDESSVEKSAAAGDSSDELSQEDKPRSRIVAEYLAHGYVLSDKAVERALALDQQHGLSARFTNALKSFDDKYKVTPKTRDVDQKYSISQQAQSGFNTLQSYFEKAVDTPTGHRLLSFYEAGQKQVLDVHNEARRLANLKTKTSVPGTDKTKCNCAGESGVCGCESGKCACSSCPKNDDVSSSTDAEKAALHKESETPATSK